MSAELKSLLETVDGIRIPHLRQDAVVVATRMWPEERPDLADNDSVIRFLDAFMRDDFPGYFAHPVKFAWAGAPGEGRISNVYPNRENFESDEQFKVAEELWEEYNHQPGPWEDFGHDKWSVKWVLKNSYGWNANDTDYDPPEVPIKEDRGTRMARVEAERKSKHDEMAEAILGSLTENVRLFRTDQLLEDAEDHDWICFHDVITAIVDIEHFIVLFYGYLVIGDSDFVATIYFSQHHAFATDSRNLTTARLVNRQRAGHLTKRCLSNCTCGEMGYNPDFYECSVHQSN